MEVLRNLADVTYYDVKYHYVCYRFAATIVLRGFMPYVLV
jgi:hypothetical protein